jgi:TraB family protein
MKAVNLLLPLLLLPPGLAAGQTNASTATAEEIIVTGRQPGPPMWRVSNGENVLWIFPQLAPVPKDMIWESNKAATVIAEAQEVLELPNISPNASPLLYMNPVNLFRGMRLAKRLSRDADGRTLEETLPRELYARFQALQARYFPNEAEEFVELRPLVAGARMIGTIQRKEGLGEDHAIMKAIQQLIRRNRDIERTRIEVEVNLEGSFGDLAQRAEELTASLDPAVELECFESQLRRMEEDIDEMRSRANSWARGYIDEFRGIPLPGGEDDSCMALIVGSSEQDLIVESTLQLQNLWLENADRVLQTNRTTFAILPITELLKNEGPIAKLKAKGYQVREP